LIDLTHDERGVEAELRHSDGQVERAQAGWLVGCDGAHSSVRHLLGLQFAGSTLEQSFASFAVGNLRLDWDLANDEVYAFLHEGNFIGYFPMASGRHRVVIAYAPDKAPTGDVTLEEVQQAIDACGPPGARGVDPTELTRFHINQRRTEHYRVSRVFLAGDAAHIHSPIGAQGMNTGIQDALNLSWKLALAVKGHASARLLESYAAEREQVGDRLLRTTDLTTHLALTRNPLVAALRDALTPVLFASLPIAARRLSQSLAEMNVSYPDSAVSVDRRDHKGVLRAGDRAPDGVVRRHGSAEPQTLFAVLNPSQHSVLLVFTGDREAGAIERQWRNVVTLLSDGYQEVIEAHQVTLNASSGSLQQLLHDETGELHKRYAAQQGGMVLIRPDGYIGLFAPFGGTEPLRSYLEGVFVPG
jgi:2-polyprenyl-6-methoxyphenol hydroxylase-like FAD-dependent oxidoreductase